MKQWEYKMIRMGAHELFLKDWEDFLNVRGSEGWELVQYHTRYMINNPHQEAGYTFAFKREKIIDTKI